MAFIVLSPSHFKCGRFQVDSAWPVHFWQHLQTYGKIPPHGGDERLTCSVSLEKSPLTTIHLLDLSGEANPQARLKVVH